MRLVGVIATSFVLLSVLIYGFQHRKELGLNLLDRVETVLPAQFAAVDADRLPSVSSDNEVILPMREAGRLNAFTGFPGYTKATFVLPQRSTPQTGVLVLDLNGALERGAQGHLRVVVNGVPRTELVLSSGRLRRQIMVPLNARDLSRPSVVVAVSAEGRAPQPQCSAEWNGGIFAQIMPSSHLKLVVDAPLSAPVDILATYSAPLRFEWPSNATLRARALKAAHRASFDVPGILFANKDDGALTLDQDLLSVFEDQIETYKKAAPNPLDIGNALGRKQSISFREEAQWRMNFDRRAFPEVAVAEQLELSMRYDSTGYEGGWLLAVFLNDQLVHSEAIQDASGKLHRQISLAIHEQDILNDLRVKLTSAEKYQNTCTAGRPATAEVEAARLSLSGKEQDGDWAQIRRVLSHDLHLKVHAQLDALGAQLALNLMNSVMGETGLTLQTSWDDPTDLSVMTAVPIQALEEFLGKSHDQKTWIVVPYKKDNQLVAIHRVEELTPSFFSLAPRAVLVIEEQPHFSSAGSL